MLKVSPPQKIILKKILETTMHLEGDNFGAIKHPMAMSAFNGCQRAAIKSLASKSLVALSQQDGEDVVEATELGYTATFVRSGVAKINRGQVPTQFVTQ